MPKYKFAIAACARWESEFIVEWLNYYRFLGYDHIYLYCNDDDPMALFERVCPFTMGTEPFVTFRYWKTQGEHREMMLDFIDRDISDAEWVSFFDIDEFLRLPTNQTISEFMAEFENRADSVLVNWVFFGPNGHKTHPGTPVLSTYTRREAHVHPFTKQISRSSLLADMAIRDKCHNNNFVHKLMHYTSAPFRCVNVLGEGMASYYDNFPADAVTFLNTENRHERLLSKAVIHHYAFRSEKAFLDRELRGLGGNFADEKMWADLAKSPEFTDHLARLNQSEDRTLMDQWRSWIHRSYQKAVLQGTPLASAARSLGLPWPLPAL